MHVLNKEMISLVQHHSAAVLMSSSLIFKLVTDGMTHLHPVAMQNQFQLVSTSTHVLCFPILEKEMENWFCVSCITAVPFQGSALQHPTVQ